MVDRRYVPDGSGLYLVVSPLTDGEKRERDKNKKERGRKKRSQNRNRGRLTDVQVRNYAKGRTSAYWALRYMLDRKARQMCLGPYPEITLKRAREKALAARTLKAERTDPLDHRKAARVTERLEAARSRTFRECAETYIDEQTPNWRDEKHAKQWRATLGTYAYPVIGDIPVAAVDAPLIKEILSPIWFEKAVTAKRVQNRIATILDWATSNDYRTGDNPGRRNLFPTSKRAAARRTKHHAALPYAELPAFLSALKPQFGKGTLALQFAILTAGRTREVICATWEEIDFDEAAWTIPAERMKSERDHRVPLSKPAIAILENQHAATGGNGYIFPGIKHGRPINHMAMLETLERMGRSDITVHGFRSTFKDWAAERTAFPNEVSEAALAHVVGGAVERAYRRGDMFEKRRKLMNAWANYCSSGANEDAKVVPMRKAAV